MLQTARFLFVGALASPWVLPSGASAAAATAAAAFPAPSLQAHPYHYHLVDDHSLCMACLGLGTAFSVLTFASTSRFLLSFYPGMEKRARQGRGPLVFRATVALDAVLEPAQRCLFRLVSFLAAESPTSCAAASARRGRAFGVSQHTTAGARSATARSPLG